jgi:hypothetical protein
VDFGLEYLQEARSAELVSVLRADYNRPGLLAVETRRWSHDVQGGCRVDDEGPRKNLCSPHGPCADELASGNYTAMASLICHPSTLYCF